jgi:hypothetical protein
MPLSLATFAFALLQAVGIHARVIGRDGLVERPEWVSKAVAARLRQGVRALEGFLRRVLILMALEIEPDLKVVVRPENLAWAKAKVRRARRPLFRIYPSEHYAACPDLAARLPWAQRPAQAGFVPIDRWMARLDHLRAIAKDPTAKARRLAYHLARRRHGLLMPPPERPGLLRRWGTEASALHDAMAVQIMTKSRTRPPPLPPPRNGAKPMITLL